MLEGTHSIEADGNMTTDPLSPNLPPLSPNLPPLSPNLSPHNTVNKQINDKERVSAAMENADLVSLVEECLKDN